MSESEATIFRAEAVRHKNSKLAGRGGAIDFAPKWATRAYWLLSAMVLGALVFAALATVHDYARGPAVLRLDGHLDVRAPGSGVVDAVDVRLGQRVRAGMPLVHLHAADEAAELARVRQELDAALVRMLRDPADASARQALAQLRAQRDAAEARAADRRIVAADDGIVMDLRVHPGQSVAPGDLVASLRTSSSRLYVVALLPGSARPQLRPGMPLRIEMSGYRYAYQEAIIESVSSAVIGPAEARRYLGGEVADTLTVAGPLTLLTARLPLRQFVVDGHALDYYEGMSATASARLRRRSVLSLFVPWLRALVSHDD